MSALGTPQDFFRNFVARRRPVVIKGLIPELAGRPAEWWASPAARGLEVQVEVRDGPRESFGQGRRQKMNFGDLVSQLDAGCTSLYLTTQENAAGDLVAPPLTALDDVLPARPRLLDTLVPHNINLWLGRSAELTSSGLHHDYHDNLYVLLRGTKAFRLYSPADAHRMRTVGSISTVHPNGRISYRGELPTTEDGRTAEDVAEEGLRLARLTQRRAEARLQQLEDQASHERSDASAAAIDRAEEELDEAMEGAIEAQTGVRRARRRAQTSAAKSALPSAASSSSSSSSSGATPPPNFSRFGSLDAEGGVLSADIAQSGARLAECTLTAGSMLYLPAGWFHEVRSVGSHCALNYWYHPPIGRATYRTPYGRAQRFWEREWRRSTSSRGKHRQPAAPAAEESVGQ